MSRGAGAAPSHSRYVGLTTLLAALCLLGLATSQAVAQGFPQQTEPTTTPVATAPAPPPPAPDPKPAPKPDPKPARPKQAVRPKAPPPPPATVERAARRPVATTALAPTAPPEARRRKPKAASRPLAPAVATPTRRPVRKVRRGKRVTSRVTRGRPARSQRKTPVVPASQALDFAVPPVALGAASKPVPLIAVPTILPLLLGIGIVLLLGASVASRRLVPWPEVAEPLYARRHDLVAVGFGAIVLALLGLNAAVLF